jgi:dihydrofolate reductase
MIKAILACDDTGGVSKDGTLPWPNNPKDLAWFKSNTSGHIVVMGSTTWEDPHMPRPLPSRTNVLATSRPDEFPGAHEYINGDLNVEVQEIADATPGLITWVIGGPNIIEQTLGVIDEFYLSRIPGDYDCDTHLPLKKIKTLFDLSFEEKHNEVTFQIWRKKN